MSAYEATSLPGRHGTSWWTVVRTADREVVMEDSRWNESDALAVALRLNAVHEEAGAIARAEERERVTAAINSVTFDGKVYGEPIGEPRRGMLLWKHELAAALATPADFLGTRPPSFADAIRIARGCHVYGGGYCGDGKGEAFQHGISTVVSALEGAAKNGLADTQVAALHRMGGEK